MGDVIFLADKLSVILMTLSVTFIDNLVDMRVIDNRFELNSQAVHGTDIENNRTLGEPSWGKVDHRQAD